MSLNLHLHRETEDGIKISEFNLLQTPTEITIRILNGEGGLRKAEQYGKEPYLSRYIKWVKSQSDYNNDSKKNAIEHINALVGYIGIQEEYTKGKFCWFLL